MLGDTHSRSRGYATFRQANAGDTASILAFIWAAIVTTVRSDVKPRIVLSSVVFNQSSVLTSRRDQRRPLLDGSVLSCLRRCCTLRSATFPRDLSITLQGTYIPHSRLSRFRGHIYPLCAMILASFPCTRYCNPGYKLSRSRRSSTRCRNKTTRRETDTGATKVRQAGRQKPLSRRPDKGNSKGGVGSDDFDHLAKSSGQGSTYRNTACSSLSSGGLHLLWKLLCSRAKSRYLLIYPSIEPPRKLSARAQVSRVVVPPRWFYFPASSNTACAGGNQAKNRCCDCLFWFTRRCQDKLL